VTEDNAISPSHPGGANRIASAHPPVLADGPGLAISTRCRRDGTDDQLINMTASCNNAPAVKREAEEEWGKKETAGGWRFRSLEVRRR
jgi:hypothetical protein